MLEEAGSQTALADKVFCFLELQDIAAALARLISDLGESISAHEQPSRCRGMLVGLRLYQVFRGHTIGSGGGR